MSSNSATDNAAHGTLTSYVIGFVLCIVLTLLSFGMVMKGWASPASVASCLVGLAIIQLIVQLVYFLHLGTSKSQTQRTMIFLFTVVLLFIVVGGTVWVMHNMVANMMPGMH